MLNITNVELEECLDVVKRICDEGGNVNDLIKDRFTCLYLASMVGDSVLVQSLLDRGAEVDKPTKDGATPLLIASVMGRQDIVKNLFKEKVDAKIFPLLTEACAEDYLYIITTLLDRGANVNQICGRLESSTPLIGASVMGHHDIVKVLLDKGAKPSQPNNFLETPLFLASIRGHVDIVKTLLDRGAAVNLRTCYMETCLNMACWYGRHEVFKILIEKGADLSQFLNIDTNTGYSNVEVRINYDTIVHKYVVSRVSINHIHFIRAKFPLYSLPTACYFGHLNIVNILLDLVNKNNHSLFEYPPLTLACANNHLPIAKVLLERGASTNQAAKITLADCTSAGQFFLTPLYLAAMMGLTDMVRLLLDNGAEVDRVIKRNGATPLHIACLMGHYNTVELLLDRGANINLISHNCYNFTTFFRYKMISPTPLLMAILGKNKTILRLLLEKGALMSRETQFFGRFPQLQGSNKPINCLSHSFSGINGYPDISFLLCIAYKQGYYDVFLIWLNKMVESKATTYDVIDGCLINAFSQGLDDVVDACVDIIGIDVKKRFEFKNFLEFWCPKVINDRIQQHLVKLKAVGLFDEDIGSIDTKLLDRCKTEIENLKAFKIWNNVSLSVVLKRTKDPNYLKNQDLMGSLEKYLSTEMALEQFPLYSKILRNRLLSSKYRLTLLTKVSETLAGLEWWDKLPLLVQEDILGHLLNKHLEKMCRE